MSVEQWVAVGTFAILIVGVIVRVERRMGKALTREEHEQICKDRNQQVENKLDALRRDMDRRHEENRETFDRVETAVTGTHKLIIDIYRDLSNQRGGR